MRILLTNSRLDSRGGADIVVRDLALALQRRGHSVMAYTSSLRDQERLLESDGVPVCTSPQDLAHKPDIIHGQHHLDAMTAILSLPGVPAIYHCHGAVWRDMQPRHPRIFRYVAMSRTLKERMLIESNFEESVVEVVLNAVDTERFVNVRTPVDTLKRALFYSGFHQENSPTLLAVREACATAGLDLETAGKRTFRRIEKPEKELPEYDLVFASGKSAIDALACGCSVILLGRNSAGSLVTPENFEQLRQVNFSVAANRTPPRPEAIVEEIGKYRAEDCAEVTRLLRTLGSIDRVAERLETIYEEVIEQSRRTKEDLAAELAGTAAYLRKLTPIIKVMGYAQDEEKVPLVTLDALYETRTQAERLLTELNWAL